MTFNDVYDQIVKVQTENLTRTARSMLADFAERGRCAPRRVTGREHGYAGWLGLSYFGVPRKEPSGRYAADALRIALYPSRAAARRADCGDQAEKVAP